MKAKGLAVDSYRGRPVAGMAFEWTNDFFERGFRTATFSIKKYGAKHAVGLCEVWVRIMQRWYDCWVASGGAADCHFEVADVEGCTSPDALAEISALPKDHPVRSRWNSFREIFPRWLA